MNTAPTEVAHQFEDATQQRESATLGMWIFLATEVLFFGAMFLGYTIYRISFPQAFADASRQTLLVFGTVNTAILLLSSLVMALAVRAVEQGQRFALATLLTLTALLGTAFLAIKGFEYAHEIREGLLPGAGFHIASADPQHARMFFYLYFLMTGIHALHMSIGVVLLAGFAVRALFCRKTATLGTAVDLLGLYWHFVDIVWVFLFPLIYLAGRHP
jgi:cytochrome c oxidase subunit 3